MFSKRFVFDPWCSPPPRIHARITLLFVILFVRLCNQMKVSTLQQTAVIVCGHCVKPSNMHLNTEQFLCYSGNLRHAFVFVGVFCFYTNTNK